MDLRKDKLREYIEQYEKIRALNVELIANERREGQLNRELKAGDYLFRDDDKLLHVKIEPATRTSYEERAFDVTFTRLKEPADD